MVIAHEDDFIYGKLLRAITGVVFLGTPHRGSSVADIGTVVGKIINLCTANSSTGIVRADLLEYLQADGKPLQDLAVSVRNRLGKVKVVSFYESSPTPPLSSLVSFLLM